MKSFYVAATGQDVGKTTTCLGLVSGFLKRGRSVGYIKPVGQEHVETESGERVDKDVVLFRKTFKIKDPYPEMSPVLFPRGFTKDYLDGRINHGQLVEKIRNAHRVVTEQHEITVIEGTGHTGVGSIVDLNNAQVAKLLDCPIILVASGGLGSSFDELALNYLSCASVGAKVVGVILNRVLEEKREMIEEYVPKALKRWNLPLLGCIPYNSFLSTPTMNDFEILFQTKLVAGEEHRLRHYQHIRMAATSVEIFRGAMIPNELIITPAAREDIILAILTKFWDQKMTKGAEELDTGLILTGKIPPKASILEQIKRAGIPTLYAPLSSFIALKMINSTTSKIREEDQPKVKEAMSVVEKHIDFQKLETALHS
jgi:BioD-like phosphotransacetylase family protein